MDEARCIVLLGSAGSGKTSLANAIFGDDVFEVNHSPNSGQTPCLSEAKHVNGRALRLIDTPDFLDPKMNDVDSEILKCFVECAPGPHALLLVLKVEMFTWFNSGVIDGYLKFIINRFSPEALDIVTVVFTHGDELPEGGKIKDWVKQNEALSSLVQKCGGRCHVFDNKHWNGNQDPEKNNQHQVTELLRTIEETVENRGEEFYTNKTLEKLEEELKQEMKSIREAPGNKRLPKQQIRAKAKENIIKKPLHKSATEAPNKNTYKYILLCACGVVVVVALAMTKPWQDVNRVLQAVKQVSRKFS